MKNYIEFISEGVDELSGKFSFFNFLQIVGNHDYHFISNDHFTKLYKYQYYFSTETITNVNDFLEVFKYKHALASSYKVLTELKGNKICFFFGIKDKTTLRYGFLDTGSQKSHIVGEFDVTPKYFRSIMKYKAVSSISRTLSNINFKNIDILRKIKQDLEQFMPEEKSIKIEIVGNRVIKTFGKIFEPQDIENNKPFMLFNDWIQTQEWVGKVDCSVNDGVKDQIQFVVIIL